MPRKRRTRRVLEFLAALGVGYLVCCFILARQYLQPSRHVPIQPRGLDEISIPDGNHAADPAWCTPRLKNGGGSPVVFVIAHGYGGDRGSNAILMLDLAKHGIDSIAPALPGQDSSPRPQVGFGITEAETLVRAANWVREREPKAKVVYLGVSMGGAAAWLASKDDPTAAGVVSEGAYARFDEAMTNWFESKATGSSVYLRPVVWMASAMAGLKPADVVPLNAAEKWNGRPALVIQAGDDKLILLSHAQRLAAASGGDLWVVPGASHANCYDQAKTEYLGRLLAFSARLMSTK